jgi:tetratricopeptide (TPR) repeat protein
MLPVTTNTSRQPFHHDSAAHRPHGGGRAGRERFAVPPDNESGTSIRPVSPGASTMAKIGRNDPCPCGSGKKYKKCCESVALEQSAERARVARLAEAERVLATPPRGARPMPETAGYFEDDLDELSNGVVDLIDARRFDEALGACERLLLEYPEVIDGLERSAMVHEARGNHALALDFYRRALAFTELPDQHDGFDEDGREYFRERIAELDARLRSPTS